MANTASIPRYQAEFYVSAEGISREVITTEICKWLGSNAYVIRPQLDENGTTVGYWYMGYRAFTDEMVRSLKENTIRWAREKERNMSATGESGTYVTSSTKKAAEYVVGPPPPPAEPDPPSTGRWVQGPDGTLYDRITGQYFVQATNPPPAIPRTDNAIPRYVPNKPTTAPPLLAPSTSLPQEYWTIDPATGKRVYVRGGHIVQWGD